MDHGSIRIQYIYQFGFNHKHTYQRHVADPDEPGGEPVRGGLEEARGVLLVVDAAVREDDRHHGEALGGDEREEELQGAVLPEELVDRDLVVDGAQQGAKHDVLDEGDQEEGPVCK